MEARGWRSVNLSPMSAVAPPTNAIGKLKSRFYDLNALYTALALFDWDLQTFMPKGGAEARGEQSGILGRLRHEMLVSDETARLIEAAEREAVPGSEDASLARVCRRAYDLATKIPAELVEKKLGLTAKAFEAWGEARATNNFSTFEPYLEQMFELARQEAEYLGYSEHIYDALIDQYEEGATEADCRRMYETLKVANVELIQAIRESGVAIDDSALYGEWSHEQQARFTEMLVKDIGFNMENGRQDTAPHPFCTNFSVRDVRLTTRFKPYIGSAIFGSLHEAGHGMYEQGSPVEWDRTPLAGGVSLGIHESQSRTWENIVGRSKAFWSRYLPKLQAAFPGLATFDLDRWYRAINKVEPSYIRVEADEVTYNMHTLVRFEVESAVLTGAISVKEIPGFWNEKYQKYLGITPRNDGEGCLQDMHWAGGSIGYFPTYSMGNCLSFQFWNVLKRDLGDVDSLIAGGEFEPILGWLQEKIYRQGCRYTPKELVERVSGKPMGAEDYLAALKVKYGEIYSLS